MKILRWIITLVVIGVVGYFFARSLIDNWSEFQSHQLAFDWGWVLATILFALAVALTGVVWARVVRVVEKDVPITTTEAVAVQSLSWVLKYIPGQVGSVANKVLWAKKKGISRMLIIISFVYENVFLQIASIVPAAVILLISLGPQIFGDNVTLLLLPLLVLIPMAMIMYRPLFHKIVNLPAKKVLKQDVPRDYFLSTWQSLRASLEFVGPRIVNGVGFVFIAESVSDITPSDWLPFAAAYVLAGAIGILAIFVPSGLGVREAIIVAILSQYIPVPEAILISLIARLLSTIGDLLVAGTYLVTRRTIPKEIRP
ncbi:lysylphosphatidylglycerol synthase domain-containing protein [Cumulibacter soli]|uniref:lysylphosphatidylglycerol synthase domain-containing protein n=1 Tax=Cumulibacter soli TaxID=2546344 RepID=UPI001067FF93|nr:lysylphosphatidylglycerol synthase domain-containing protein [Cumulibacter soli]